MLRVSIIDKQATIGKRKDGKGSDSVKLTQNYSADTLGTDHMTHYSQGKIAYFGTNIYTLLLFLAYVEPFIITIFHPLGFTVHENVSD